MVLYISKINILIFLLFVTLIKFNLAIEDINVKNNNIKDIKNFCNNYKELCSQNYLKKIKDIDIISVQEKLLKIIKDEKLCDKYKKLCTQDKNETFIYYSFVGEQPNNNSNNSKISNKNNTQTENVFVSWVKNNWVLVIIILVVFFLLVVLIILIICCSCKFNSSFKELRLKINKISFADKEKRFSASSNEDDDVLA